MTGESGLATIQETARRIAASKGLALADVPGLIISPDLPRFGDLRHTDALRGFLADDEIEVLIIDPAYLAIPTDGNEASLFAMGGLLRNTVDVCSSVGAMMALAHHTKKTVTDPFAMPELESIAWAGFQEFARQWLLVGRRERYEPGSGQHRLWLNVGGSTGHSGCYAVDVAEGVYDGHAPRRWELAVMHVSEARDDAAARIAAAKDERASKKADAQLEADRKAIVATMVKIKAPETETTIRNKAKVRNPRFGLAWESLIDDRTVESAGEVKKGNNRAYPAYQLRQDSTG